MGHLVVEEIEDIELKFDGDLVRRLHGAPAEAVLASLGALQRMLLIIGMGFEGKDLGQRLKPSAKVKREYALICKAPKEGSYIQPFSVSSQAGNSTPSSINARLKLVRTLKAFSSGDEDNLRRVVPSARERKFLAEAARGLIPDQYENLHVRIRVGASGRYSFKSEAAQSLIESYSSSQPIEDSREEIYGRLKVIDFGQALATVRTSSNNTVKFGYNLRIEEWIKANVRKNISIFGEAIHNSSGKIKEFKKVEKISELEATLDPIEFFYCGGVKIKANMAIRPRISYVIDDGLFYFHDEHLDIDVYSESYQDIRSCIIDELQMLWVNYAMAPDSELADDAIVLKNELISRFSVLENE